MGKGEGARKGEGRVGGRKGEGEVVLKSPARHHTRSPTSGETNIHRYEPWLVAARPYVDLEQSGCVGIGLIVPWIRWCGSWR